jgi:hypothetical protein
LHRRRPQFFIDVGGSYSTAALRSTIAFRRVPVIVQLIESLHHLVSQTRPAMRHGQVGYLPGEQDPPRA